jgi:hypothetical protein
MHPSVADASQATHVEFMKCLLAGVEEWGSKLGVDLNALNDRVRTRLFDPTKIARLLPDETLNLLRIGTAYERSSALTEVLDRFRGELVQELPISQNQKGRKRTNKTRDEQAYKWHKQGMSYSQIAIKLKSQFRNINLSRQGVEAACRREAEYRRRFHQIYLELRPQLWRVGIRLEEQSPGRISTPSDK